jgi:hypothetical protein
MPNKLFQNAGVEVTKLIDIENLKLKESQLDLNNEKCFDVRMAELWKSRFGESISTSKLR